MDVITSLPPIILFECRCSNTVVGEALYLLGNVEELGTWAPEKAIELVTSEREFPKWTSRIFAIVSVPKNELVEFKLIKGNSHHIRQRNFSNLVWEPGANRRFRCPTRGQFARISCTFGDTNVRVTLSDASEHAIANNASLDSFVVTQLANEVAENRKAHQLHGLNFTKDLQMTAGPLPYYAGDHSAPVVTVTPPKKLESLDAPQKIALVEEIELCDQWKRRWATHLPSSASAHFANHDKENPSMRLKLLLIKEVLDRAIENLSQTQQHAKDRTEVLTSEAFLSLVEAVGSASLYASFVQRQQLKCSEDSGHHRPSHLAWATRSIIASMELIMAFSGATDSAIHNWNVDLFSKCYFNLLPYLPSTSSQFCSAEPLTRIRDIAHRGDICQDLKSEIKNRLQNKLHRCAGPEDLVTATEFLRRFEDNPHQYPEGFIKEFQIFYRELKDFFCADTLVERLNSISGDPMYSRQLQEQCKFVVNHQSMFEEAVKSHDADLMLDVGSKLLNGINLCTKTMTKTISDIVDSEYNAVCSEPVKLADISSGFLTNNDRSIYLVQSLRLAFLSLTNYCFVVLSHSVNCIESAERDSLFKLTCSFDPQTATWLGVCMRVLNSGLVALGRTNSCRGEVGLICEELDFITSKILLDVHLKRKDFRMFLESLNGLLDRCLRLLREISDTSSIIWNAIATQLGASLPEVSTATTRVYAESKIRSDVSFQIARLVSLLQNLICVHALKKRPFSVICGGVMKGFSVLVSDLTSLTIKSQVSASDFVASDSSAIHVIVWVEEAQGEEEVVGLSDLLESKLNAHLSGSGTNFRFILSGIVLLQPIPLLSHLGVRCRQHHIKCICISSLMFLDSMRCDINTVVMGNFIKVDPNNEEPVQGGVPQPRSSPSESPIFKKNSLAYPNSLSSILGVYNSQAKFEKDLHRTLTNTSSASFHGSAMVSRNKFSASSRFTFPTYEESLASGPSHDTTTSSQIFQVLINPQQIDIRCGSKAAVCSRLMSLLPPAGIRAPTCAALPLDALDALLATRSQQTSPSPLDQMHAIFTETDPSTLKGTADKVESFILSLPLDNDVELELKKCLDLFISDISGIHHVMVRSSANVEDLEHLSAAGLYLSVPVQVNSPNQISDLWHAIKEVWASLYSYNALAARHAANVTKEPKMGILIQNILLGKWSFILHTQSPSPISTINLPSDVRAALITSEELTSRESWMLVELAPGLGDALASSGNSVGGGSALRLFVLRKSLHEDVNSSSTSKISRGYFFMDSACSFGWLWTNPQDIVSSNQTVPQTNPSTSLKLMGVSHTKQPTFHWDEALLQSAVDYLITIADTLDGEFRTPQDAEGGFLYESEKLVPFVVQSRPQPL